MKCYLLLRNNQEKGPYSLEEMRSLELKPQDLVWIEGKSHKWQYPAEIQELKPFVAQGSSEQNVPLVRIRTKREESRNVYVLLPEQNAAKSFSYKPEEGASATGEKLPELETKFSQSLDDIKEMYVASLQNRTFSTKKVRFTSHFSSLIVLLVGLFGGAFMVQKVVSGLNNPSGSWFSKKATAPLTVIPEAVVVEEAADKTYQNAITTELLPALDSVQVKNKPKPLKYKELLKMVKLKNSDYKVSVFGGVSEFIITVSNTSPYVLDKINVQVDYYRPNGQLILTESFSAHGVKPDASKKIQIPATNRGVKVKYRVTNIHSDEYKALTKEM